MLVAVTSGLACCGKDDAQRAAFITFLQNRIINKPGLHIPILSEKETADIGPYADQYRIMNGFHHKLNDAISADIDRMIKIGNPRSVQELADHRAILPVLKTSLEKMQSALDKAEAEADTARKALKQPPDLKAVYDAAYDHMVTKPAAAYREVIALMQRAFPAVADLAAFLDEHRNVIEYRGGTPVTNDPAARSRLAALMEAATHSSKLSEEGKRKMRAMLEGR